MEFNLEHFLSTYTKAELIDLLCNVMRTGVLPPFPDSFQIEDVPAEPMRGRPSKERLAIYATNVALTLAAVYPERITLSVLSQTTGYTAKSLRNWSRNSAFLAALPTDLRAYYLDTCNVGIGQRLPTDARVILDVHNYLWTVITGGERLPFHAWHAQVFGLLPGSTLPAHDAGERNRLRRSVFLAALNEAGLPLPVFTRDADAAFLREPAECLVMAAILGGTLPNRLRDIWDLLLFVTPIPVELVPPGAKRNSHIRNVRTYEQKLGMLLGNTD